jgi:hypothetical protein
MSSTTSVQLQSLNKLYLKRRSQRNKTLRKVIKQWHQLQHSEWFFNTLEVWRSVTEEHELVSEDFLDRIADTIDEDYALLDRALDQLMASHKRVHEAIETRDRKPYSDRFTAPIVKPAGGKYDFQQVRNIITRVVIAGNLGKEQALSILDKEGGVKTTNDLKPEDLDKVYEACQRLLDSGGASIETEGK